MTNNAIATRDGEVVLSASEVALVKTTVAAGATDEELRLFLHDCRRQGVHPLDKLIHFTKRGGRYTPITSIDFMRMRAADTGELAGNDDPTYVFKDGETVLPQSASVTVHRLVQGQRCPFTATARWAEYKPPSGQDHMWLKMPQLMLGKCAEALALRKAFPKQLHGIYERAEMAQAGPEDTKPTRGATRKEDETSHNQPERLDDRSTPAVPPSPAREVQSAEQIDAESRNLFEPPDVAEERSTLMLKAQEIIKRRKIGTKAVRRLKQEFMGSEEANPATADLAALQAVVRHLEEVTP